MSFAAFLRGLRAVGSLAGLVVEGAQAIGRLVKGKPKPAEPASGPLTYKDVERINAIEHRAGHENDAPPVTTRSRYD